MTAGERAGGGEESGWAAVIRYIFVISHVDEIRRFGEESSGDLEICLARSVKELGPAIGAVAELQC